MKRLMITCAATFVLCCCLLAGCSSGGSTASSAASPSASSGSASADVSAVASTASASSAASFSADAASASAAASLGGTDDFDRAIVGTWHIYKAEFAHIHDGGNDKYDADTIALLRKYGLHHTITIFSDGTFTGTDNFKGTWVQKDRNVLALTFYDDEEPIDLTLKDNRLTLVDPDAGTIVYARG